VSKGYVPLPELPVSTENDELPPEYREGGASRALPQRIDWEDILDVCPDSVIVLDNEFRIACLNRRACETAGRDSSELLGQRLPEVLPELMDSEVERRCQDAMKESSTVDFEWVTKSGSRFEARVHPCGPGVVIYYRERTCGCEARPADFLKAAAIPIHSVGSDGTILWANDAELHFLGYEAQEYVGHHISEFHLDQPLIRDILERLTSGQELREQPAQLRCKDGSVRSVAISSNGYFRGGRFNHTLCFTRDVGHEKLNQELHARLAAIVESSDDAIISKDLNGIIRSWNRGAERIFGYSAAEAIGQPITMLAAPDRIDEIPNIIERITRGERIDHYQTKRRAKDGRILSISLTVSPVRDHSGRIVGASKIARDVSEQERIQEALRAANDSLQRSNADLETFAYSASHDLQEPLRMIAVYSELLIKRFGGQLEPAAEEYIGHIVDGALRMQQLLKDLRAYTQASSMAIEGAQAVDAQVALQRSLENLSAAIAEAGASITFGALPTVAMHEFQLGQLFQNLIGNALRYRSAAVPKIHVAADRCGTFWRFSVKDNGIGIEPRYQEQIFGIFKRLHASAEYPGTGMGLAICQRIVERVGGRLWVESEPGRGSTFLFTVPAAGEQA
jgi:PAS domain S-box-containing protein